MLPPPPFVVPHFHQHFLPHPLPHPLPQQMFQYIPSYSSNSSTASLQPNNTPTVADSKENASKQNSSSNLLISLNSSLASLAEAAASVEGERQSNAPLKRPCQEDDDAKDGHEKNVSKVSKTGDEERVQSESDPILSPKEDLAIKNSINRENSFSNVILGDGGMVRGMSAVMEMGGFGLSDLASTGAGNPSCSSVAVWGGVDGFPGGSSQNGSSASLNTNVDVPTVVGILDPPAPTASASNIGRPTALEGINSSSSGVAPDPAGMPLSMIHQVGVPVVQVAAAPVHAITPISNSGSTGSLIASNLPAQPMMHPYYLIPTRAPDGSIVHTPFHPGNAFQPQLFAMPPPSQFISSTTPSALGSSSDLPQQYAQQHQSQENKIQPSQQSQFPATTATITPDSSQYAILTNLQPPQMQPPWMQQQSIQQQQQQQQMQLHLQQQQQSAAAAGYYFMHPQMFQPHQMIPQVIATTATAVAPSALLQQPQSIMKSPKSIPKRGGNSTSRRGKTSPTKRKRFPSTSEEQSTAAAAAAAEEEVAVDSNRGMVMSMVDAAGKVVYVATGGTQNDMKWQRQPDQADYYNNNSVSSHIHQPQQHQQIYYNYYQQQQQQHMQQQQQDQQNQHQYHQQLLHDSEPESESKVHDAEYNHNQQQHLHHQQQYHNATASASLKNSVPRRYLCSLCSKRFTRPSTLRTHMNSHTGERPFVCTAPGCGWKFTVLSNLKRHLKICPSVQQAGGLSAAADVLKSQSSMRATLGAGSRFQQGDENQGGEEVEEEEGDREMGGGCVGSVEAGQW